MRKLRLLVIWLMILVLMLSFASCGNTVPDTGSAEEADEHSESHSSASEETSASGSMTLVIVFSATGNTKRVAQLIASELNADIYEIVPKEPYSEDDINWRDKNSRSSKEHSDPTFRPEIGSEEITLQGYSTVYIGYPIWWGEEPRIMDTFVESHDFTGITVIPFCTSSSSGIGRSGINMKEKAGTGTWLEGMRFSENAPEEEIRNWLDTLG